MPLLTLKTILVASDLTEPSDAAVTTAARIADTTGATLHVAHVAPAQDELNTATDRRAEYEQEIGKRLELAKSTTQAKAHLMFGEPRRAISLLAGELEADVVVLGRRDGKLGVARDHSVGATAYAFITQTRVPVLIVVEPLSIPVQNALVAIDMSDAARGSLLVALSWSAALRQRGAGTLTILHVDTGADSTERSAPIRRSVEHDAGVLERNASRWAGVTVERLAVADPDPAAAIARQAIDSQDELVILGTRSSAEHGRSIWGSVSVAVTCQLSVPVLLVPPAVWRDHVRDIDPL